MFFLPLQSLFTLSERTLTDTLSSAADIHFLGLFLTSAVLPPSLWGGMGDQRRHTWPGKVFTHADGSIAIMRVCVWFCLSVCPHDKIKTAEIKIAELGTGIVSTIPRPPINIRSKGQRSRSQGHKVQKGDRVAGVSYALYIECPAAYSYSIFH